jgi:hypothetical protein
MLDSDVLEYSRLTRPDRGTFAVGLHATRAMPIAAITQNVRAQTDPQALGRHITSDTSMLNDRRMNTTTTMCEGHWRPSARRFHRRPFAVEAVVLDG